MRVLLNLFRNKWFFQCLGLIAFCALIWFVGPMITIAGHTPLASPWIRLGVVLGGINLFLLWGLISQIRSKKADRKLMDEMAASSENSGQAAIAEATDKELMELQGKFEQAMQLLKRSSSYGKWSRKYLYELPWYVIIGAPGSGKTTLLTNSGLKFPLDERMGATTIQGVGGTRNCSWMFAENAVFLDTAGRYVTQDSHHPVDASAWQNFLNLLKKHRRQRPINGVLVSLSISDLLQWTDSQLIDYAQTVRQRTSDLYRRLGVQFPIYLLITKCDLVAGFTEFFANFDPKERRQVWGETFSDPRPEHTQENITIYEERFDTLVRRLRERLLKRLQHEIDIQRRGLMLDFPEQFASLKPAIGQFLKQAFNASRYDTTHYFLRGVYFTSGTQEGTPIDRVIGQLAATYGFDRQHQPVFSGRGKSYFIHRLLKHVIFPESELAGLDLRVVRRRRWIHSALYAGILALVGVMTVLWSFSYIHNEHAVRKVNQQIEQYEVLSHFAKSGDKYERRMLGRLNTILSADRIFAERSFWDGYGLYQGDKLRAGIHSVYTKLLLSDLLPATRKRLGLRLSQLSNSGRKEEMGELYNVLKTYLMLGLPEKMTMHSAFAKKMIQNEWGTELYREPQLQTQLATHLDNLLETPIKTQVLDQTLVRHARQMLNAVPFAVQVYTHLKSEVMVDSAHDIYLKQMLGAQGNGIFTTAESPPLEGLRIPGLFTEEGYETHFKRKGSAVINVALDQNWVLENPEAKHPQKAERLNDDLEKLYFAEYQTRWQDILNHLRVIRPRNHNHTLQMIKQLTDAESPLRLLLACVAQNTRFAPTQPNKSAKDKKPPAGREKNIFTSADSHSAMGNSQIPAPARQVVRKFQPLNDLVQKKDGAPAPLDQVISHLNQLNDVIMQSIDTKALAVVKEHFNNAGTQSTSSKIRMEFDRLPEPLRGWLLPMIDESWRMTLNAAKSELNTLWQTEVLTPYRDSLNNRYPLFEESSDEATMTDFSNFFAPDGIFNQFFKSYLEGFIDTSRTPWRIKATHGATIDLSSKAIGQLQWAHQINKNFFTDSGSTPSIQFHLKPLYLDASVLWCHLNLQGQSMKYDHGPVRSQTFQWPGPQPHLGVRISFKTLNGKQISLFKEGQWAWLKTLDSAKVDATTVPHQYHLTFKVDGVAVRYELSATSAFNPLKSRAHNLFRCPESL